MAEFQQLILSTLTTLFLYGKQNAYPILSQFTLEGKENSGSLSLIWELYLNNYSGLGNTTFTTNPPCEAFIRFISPP